MKPETGRQQKARSTRTKIFLTAVELFAQNAYENVTVQDICGKAEVSVGAFYHHFPNKESLINEGYRMFDLQVEEKWQQGHPDDPLQAIRLLVELQLEAMEEMGVPAAAQYFKNQLTTEEKYILNPERFFYNTILIAVQAVIATGQMQGDAHGLTEDILSISRGVIYDWCLHEGSYKLKEKGNRALEMVLSYYRV